MDRSCIIGIRYFRRSYQALFSSPSFTSPYFSFDVLPLRKRILVGDSPKSLPFLVSRAPSRRTKLEGTRNGATSSDDDQRFSTTLGADDPLRSHFRHTLAPLRDPIRSSPSWIIDDARAPTMPPVIVFLLFFFFFFRPTVLYRGASIVRETVEGSGRVI